ncbi:hypothetical protein ACS15_3030 [Ralstonia insidiosa]|uniref:Uncharacterized protein n=1 Tax=Ralstonia insidiosa TaxID=190721 RepID=A0AAC9FQZ4_9RALS|nr:hypothetical protein ACS15_3030 [Ralstonia insidiosa]
MQEQRPDGAQIAATSQCSICSVYGTRPNFQSKFRRPAP